MFNRPFVKMALAAAVCLFASVSLCVAQPTLQLLYSFTGRPDGSNPSGGLVMDGAGNLYGVTSSGGHFDEGTVFKVAPDGTETVLYSFCSQSGCPDGANPAAGLIMGPNGNLYGTTQNGGANAVCGGGAVGCGTVFQLSHNVDETKWKEKVLYSFCGQSACADGASPTAPLIMDAVGNLYGTTSRGGITITNTCPAGCGTVFELSNGPNWQENVLYSFCTQPDCSDGRLPAAGLIIDAGGNLYGTTVAGGTNTVGTVYRLAPDGTETVLYSFSGSDDGSFPAAGLIADAAGNLYSTTSGDGGVKSCESAAAFIGCGVVFRLTPDGVETVLHRFRPHGSPPSYPSPQTGVIADARGKLYGAVGTVTECSPLGHTTVCPAPGFAFEIRRDGKTFRLGTLPPGPSNLVMDDTGSLYGETTYGGNTATGRCAGSPLTAVGCGTIFKLIP